MKRRVAWELVFFASVLVVLLSISVFQLWSEEKPIASSAGKNLQVLEFTDKIELQLYMKGLNDSLGVTCKFCHDMKAFEKDLPELHKLQAREMMLMTKAYNDRLAEFYKKFFASDEETLMKKLDEKITCYTCHRGNEKPAFTLENAEQSN